MVHGTLSFAIDLAPSGDLGCVAIDCLLLLLVGLCVTA